MKIAFAAIAASILAIAPAAQAQSLHETHQLVWAPSGKTPVAHWRMRDRPACQAQAHHQAGKTAMPARIACVAATRQTRQAAR
jgi:hypothetical protein